MTIYTWLNKHWPHLKGTSTHTHLQFLADQWGLIHATIKAELRAELEQRANDATTLQLGQLLTSDNQTIQRNAVSILKEIQRKGSAGLHNACGTCGDPYCRDNHKTNN